MAAKAQNKDALQRLKKSVAENDLHGLKKSVAENFQDM